MTVSVFGIRHHGPGSARSVLTELRALQPDALLIEGPSDADDALKVARHPGLEPPVALLVYRPDTPAQALFYPFAIFSPEWQAIRYALSQSVLVRFIDLPVSVRLAAQPGPMSVRSDDPEPLIDRSDPIRWLAGAAGEDDPERWWERVVEQRGSAEGVFAAIGEAMATLRELEPALEPMEARREAHMRRAIRLAEREGFQRIAVVCGAWHVPALQQSVPATKDEELLRGLARVKTEAVWIPWTHGRLALGSGYGAGVQSPGWYHHLWKSDADPIVTWLSRTARLLRDEELDASAAQVVDAVRLTESLAALRGRPAATLSEVIDATLSVLCGGSEMPLAIIHSKLIVGEELGVLPPDAPAVPLQRDLEAQQRHLRLKPEASDRTLDLDLRQPNHLEISRLLHRLNLLNIPWGILRRPPGGAKGTFHEIWNLRWQPEFALSVIEAAIWGGTVVEAASARTCDVAARAEQLTELADLLDVVLLADLPDALDALISALRERSALATDTGQLMDALPPLVRAIRYGSVRHTDVEQLRSVSAILLARIFIGMVPSCSGLDDDAAAQMRGRMDEVNRAIGLLEEPQTTAEWQRTLSHVLMSTDLHGLVAGRVCRLLLDAAQLTPDAAVQRLGFALSSVAEAAQGAAWFEGFLAGSGLILLTDDRLFRVVDRWLIGLRAEDFEAALPLLRRTVATFPAGERRQIGERVKHGASMSVTSADTDLDPARVALVEPVLRALLGEGS